MAAPSFPYLHIDISTLSVITSTSTRLEIRISLHHRCLYHDQGLSRSPFFFEESKLYSFSKNSRITLSYIMQRIDLPLQQLQQLHQFWSLKVGPPEKMRAAGRSTPSA